jgi:hypothetical protein
MVEKVARESLMRGAGGMAARVFDSLPWGEVPQAERPRSPGAGRSACLQAIPAGLSSNASSPQNQALVDQRRGALQSPRCWR